MVCLPWVLIKAEVNLIYFHRSAPGLRLLGDITVLAQQGVYPALCTSFSYPDIACSQRTLTVTETNSVPKRNG